MYKHKTKTKLCNNYRNGTKGRQLTSSCSYEKLGNFLWLGLTCILTESVDCCVNSGALKQQEKVDF